MKLEKMYIVYILCVLVVLTLLGACIAGASRPLTPEEQEQANRVYAATDYAYPKKNAEHGTDEAITWEDPGMEAHIRFLLNRPDGEILRSDVWDVQVLSIQTAFQAKFDVMVTELPEGAETFDRANTLNNPNEFHNIGNRQFEPIQSLEDLKYFESLQVLSILERGDETGKLKMTGIEACENLKFVQVGNRQIKDLELVGELESIEMLFLQNCEQVQMDPIVKCANMKVLSLIGCKLETLNGIENLQKLRYLNLLESEVKDRGSLDRIGNVEMVIQ